MKLRISITCRRKNERNNDSGTSIYHLLESLERGALRGLCGGLMLPMEISLNFHALNLPARFDDMYYLSGHQVQKSQSHRRMDSVQKTVFY